MLAHAITIHLFCDDDMLKVYPVHFECVDLDVKQDMFSVKAFDECCATVKIDCVLTLELWDEIAPLIRECLVKLELE